MVKVLDFSTEKERIRKKRNDEICKYYSSLQKKNSSVPRSRLIGDVMNKFKLSYRMIVLILVDNNLYTKRK